MAVDGSSIPGDGLGWSAFGGAAVFLGIGQAARDASVQFARERRPSGMNGPIAELQTIVDGAGPLLAASAAIRQGGASIHRHAGMVVAALTGGRA